MFTTPEDWFDRFKAAGGHGRVVTGNFWFTEKGDQLPEVEKIVAELKGSANKPRYDEVLAYLQARFRPSATWVDF